ncbi:MAG: hypothetical protein KGO83_05190 [Paenibacillaceae bacterium]|nr:hypothetical protein [Paenibacillaceae bacterium]
MRLWIQRCALSVLIVQTVFSPSVLAKDTHLDDIFFSVIPKNFSKQKTAKVHPDASGVLLASFVGFVVREIVVSSSNNVPLGITIPTSTQKDLRQLYKKNRTELQKQLQRAQRSLMTNTKLCANTSCNLSQAFDAAIKSTPNPMNTVLKTMQTDKGISFGTIASTVCPIVTQLWNIPGTCTLIAHQPNDVGKITRKLGAPAEDANLCTPDIFVQRMLRYTYRTVHTKELTADIDNKKHVRRLIVCVDTTLEKKYDLAQILSLAKKFEEITFASITKISHVLPSHNDIFINFIDMRRTYQNASGFYDRQSGNKLFINLILLRDIDLLHTITHEYVHMIYGINNKVRSKWQSFFFEEGIADFFGSHLLGYPILFNSSKILRFFNALPPTSANNLLEDNLCFIANDSPIYGQILLDNIRIKKLISNSSFFYAFGSFFFQFLHEQFSKPMQKHFKSSDPYLLFKHIFKEKPNKILRSVVRFIDNEPWDTIWSLSREVLKKSKHELCIDFLSYTIQTIEKGVKKPGDQPLITSLKQKLKWMYRPK